MDESTLKQVRELIEKARAQGKTDEEIKQSMRQAGYSDSELDEVFPANTGSAPSSQSSDPGKSYCPSCGMQNAPGSKFCKGCGKPLGTAVQAQQAPPSPAPAPAPAPVPQPQTAPAPPPAPIQPSGHSSKKKLIVIAIIIGVALVSAYIIFTMFDPATNARAECEAEVKQDVMDRYSLTEQELMSAGKYAKMIYDEDDICECMTEKAVTQRKPAICAALPTSGTYYDKEDCLEEIIDEAYTASACQYLVGDDRIDCYEYISCNTGDYSLCDNIPDPDDRNYCKDSGRYCSSSFYL